MVAQPPKPAPVVQAPTAPPNPYKVAGVLVQEGASRVFLAKGDRVYEVKEGEALDDAYRVEAIGPAQVTLLYLPLGTRDVLPIQSALAVDAPAQRAEAPAEGKTPGESSGGAAQLRWEGPERVAGGASFSVALRLTTSEPLRASPMQLRFEPDVLEAVNVRAGKFYGQGSFSYRVNPEGSIFVGASSPAPAAGADAELVVFTFRPVRRGATAEVRVSSLALQGAAGRTIAHERLSAFRTVIQ